MSTVEPLSIKSTDPRLTISLRGSLASEFSTLLMQADGSKADDFMRTLLGATDENIVRFREGNSIVIGLRNERGLYFPDW